MKKITFLIVLTLFVNVAYSNGLLTNSNQSAQFIRMMSRNASLGIDGVYYNPAGLIKLENGFHFSLNNQSIFQTRSIDTKFPWLNDGYYEGKVNVPIFPSGFAVYKKDKLAFSFGFGPNAGGGKATYDRGIPSFEIPISKAKYSLAGLGVSGYDADLQFEGSSIIWGIQLGATYKINEVFSVSAGVRYVPATNKYQGNIQNIQFKVGAEYFDASEWTMGAADVAQAGADMPQTLQPLVDAGAGTLSLAQLEAIGFLSPTEVGGIEGGLMFMGIPQEQIDLMDLNAVQGAYQLASPGFQETANQLDELAPQLGDKEVDVEQTGSFFTGIVGVNISPNEFLNIGLRYEHRTFLTVENNTTSDDIGLFPDGATSRSDVPGIIAAGIGVTDNYWFEAQLSFNMYLDKYVSWGANVRDISVWQDIDDSQIRVCEIEQNSFDIALGMQFNVTDNFSLSAGGMYQKAGVADNFNSDFRFAPPSYLAFGGGLMWKVTDQLTLDAGVSTVVYKDAEVTYTDPMPEAGVYAESYGTKALSFAIGLSYSIPY